MAALVKAKYHPLAIGNAAATLEPNGSIARLFGVFPLRFCCIPLSSIADRNVIVKQIGRELAEFKQAEQKSIRVLALFDGLWRSILTGSSRREFVKPSPNNKLVGALLTEIYTSEPLSTNRDRPTIGTAA